jgi:hypothetical protein
MFRVQFLLVVDHVMIIREMLRIELGKELVIIGCGIPGR